MNLREIIEASKAEIIKKIEISEDIKLSTDTRTIENGDIYLPLKGTNFDGENFCEDAINKGAVGCFVTRNIYPQNAKIILKVKDTLETYLKLANFYRKKINPRVVMITGSSGKTTTKELVYSVLAQKYKTVKTLSNHNNEIGLCQTIFSSSADTEVLVLEAGMRGAGEIELLSKYAEPDYALITNAGSAHIGRLGSLDNIAKAKCEITKYLNPKGCLISHDNERLRKFNNFDGEKIFYSLADAKILEQTANYSKFIYKNKEYELSIGGEFNIENSISAIEVGYKLGLNHAEICKGLLSYKPIEKRWEIEKVCGFSIINDSYNANPESTLASVKSFLNLYKNPVVVLGDMGELGENEAALHFQLGENISKIAPRETLFVTVGDLSKNTARALSGFEVKSFNNNVEAAKFLQKEVHNNANVFLKASRAMKFEEIVEHLKGENG